MFNAIKQWFASTQVQHPSNTGETVPNQPKLVNPEQADRELSVQELQAISGAGARSRLGEMF